MARIIIEVPTEVHHQIKAMASLKGESIKDFVLEKIFPKKSKIPNAKTLESMKNVLEKKGLKEFDKLDDLYGDLGI